LEKEFSKNRIHGEYDINFILIIDSDESDRNDERVSMGWRVKKD
jgi:hypothetical protein